MDHGRLTIAGAIAALAGALGGCRAGVPTPPYGPHDVDEEPTFVDSAPPTVKVEIVQPPPKGYEDPRWIDGQWLWSARAGHADEGRWRWQPGQWAEWRGTKAWYAPPTLTVSSVGKLAWRPGHTHQPPAPKVPAPTR